MLKNANIGDRLKKVRGKWQIIVPNEYDIWDENHKIYTPNVYKLKTLISVVINKLDTQYNCYLASLAGLDSISKYQLNIYKLKYKKAKANDTSFFTKEAEILGIMVDDLIQIVITLGDNWKLASDNYVAKNDAIRIAINRKIETLTTPKLIKLYDVLSTFEHTKIDQLFATVKGL